MPKCSSNVFLHDVLANQLRPHISNMVQCLSQTACNGVAACIEHLLLIMLTAQVQDDR